VVSPAKAIGGDNVRVRELPAHTVLHELVDCIAHELAAVLCPLQGT
jgi:hypothetical protein